MEGRRPSSPPRAAPCLLRRARSLALTLALLCLGWAGRVKADEDDPPGRPPPAAPALPNGVEVDPMGLAPAIPEDSPWRRLGEAEWALVGVLARALGWQPAHRPDGQRVRRIEVVRAEVFQPGDPVPLWLNRLHRLTRERVVRQAITLQEGDVFDELAWRDAERQLRVANTFSVALVLPVETGEPGWIDVVVVTRDVWSLLPTWFIAGAGVVTSATVGVVETNFLGRNELLAGVLVWTPTWWSVGPRWSTPRVGSSRWSLSTQADWIQDRETGRAEGWSGGVQAARPVYDSRVRWAWSAGLQGSDRLQRRLLGATVRTWDDPSTVEVEAVEERWREQRVGVQAEATRSLGLVRKTLVGMGWSVQGLGVEPVPRAEVDPGVLAAFRAARLPREEWAVGPTWSVLHYANRWMTVTDLQSYGFSEEVRLQGSAGLSLRWSEPAMGATARFVRPDGRVLWRGRSGADGWWSAEVQQGARLEERPGTGWSDVTTSGEVRWVSPRTGWGRAVLRARSLRVARNVANAQVQLGGDTGLRGYVAGALQGTHSAIGNMEWRSRAWNVWSTRLGLVFFADAGSTWDMLDDARIRVGTGMGLRWVIPQLGTEVRAIDLGIPLVDGRRIRWSPLDRLPAPVLSVSFGQVF
jgi:hypothetical protein